MNNFPVNVNGKEYWVSRSIAVVTYVYANVNGVECVLANKRGPGLPNKVGLWNCVSGYLDYNETLEDAAIREVFEETGVNISSYRLLFKEIDSSPTREKQNVLVRYCCHIKSADSIKLTNKNAEPNEVDEVRWIPLKDIDKYDWVSESHKSKIREYYFQSILDF